MKPFTLLRAGVGVAGAALLFATAGVNPASADNFSFGIQIGPTPPPPPVVVERRWSAPHSSAVWIPGHYVWTGHRYAWTSGYYSYPPRPHSAWVPDAYPRRGNYYYYRPGHWR